MRAVTKISTARILTCLASGARWELRHPEFLGSTVTCPCMTVGCRALVCAAGAGQQEDIDALPAEELAAIALNILAADHVLGWLPMEVDDVLWTDIAGVVEPPEREVTRAAVGALSAFEFDSAVDMTDVYAAAEAALRNGEVR